MRNRALGEWLAAALTLLVLGTLGMKYPASLYSPGDLAKTHGELRCRNCHAPFQKVASESCSASGCHVAGKVGKTAARLALHNALREPDCLVCHTEHQGAAGHITKPWDHRAAAGSTQCAACHASEAERFHRNKPGGYSNPTQDCSACHTTTKWKETAFDHAAAVGATPCAACHPKPTDATHGVGAGNCARCHAAKAWKPSTFNHENAFPLRGAHHAACAKCHDTGDLARYSCLNCHEHSTARMDREHRGEGIRNYGDCLRCHRVTLQGKSYGTSHGRREHHDERRHGEDD
jgi:hypothetical protein